MQTETTRRPSHLGNHTQNASNFVASSPRGMDVLTDSEKDSKTLDFDYVATAVFFVLESNRWGASLIEVYKQHGAEWLNAHKLSGKRITVAQCNAVTDELLQYLRNRT